MTLVEVVLVIGILVVIAGIVIPDFVSELERQQLPASARRFRSFLALVQANAAFDGKQYRLRFPMEDEEDSIGTDRQPIIEREVDPLRSPEVYTAVTEPWAVGATFLQGVWCAEVRLGRPTIEQLQEREDSSAVEEALADAFEDFDPLLPPLLVEPDGTSDWVTFLLTDAPRGTSVDELAEFDRIEVIMEGSTGMCWLQRPLYEEELALFEEKRWPIVLRRDYLLPRVLTEDDVLELRDIPRGSGQ